MDKIQYRKHTVHFRCEVRYGRNAVLIPGQAIPIGFYPKEANDEKLGSVEIHVHAALFLGKRVYTDVATYPLERTYIEDEELSSSIYVHTIEDGYGYTVLKPQPVHPGLFDSEARVTSLYSIRDVFRDEDESIYVTGPACYIRTIPGIYAKLRRGMPKSPHDEWLWDVEKEDAYLFRRLPLPVILGQYDTFHHQKYWQKEAMKQAFTPFTGKVPLLSTLLQCAREGDERNIFDHTKYYYGFPASAPHEGIVREGGIYQKRIVLLPRVPHDAYFGIDKGRQHIGTWRSTFRQVYGA